MKIKNSAVGFSYTTEYFGSLVPLFRFDMDGFFSIFAIELLMMIIVFGAFLDNNYIVYGKGEFYHSLTGYLHSHIYPNLEQGLIKIGDVDYKVNKSLNDFDNCTLYTEENCKFTVLYLKSWNKPTAPMPDMAEFKFEAILNR